MPRYTAPLLANQVQTYKQIHTMADRTLLYNRLHYLLNSSRESGLSAQDLQDLCCKYRESVGSMDVSRVCQVRDTSYFVWRFWFDSMVEVCISWYIFLRFQNLVCVVSRLHLLSCFMPRLHLVVWCMSRLQLLVWFLSRLHLLSCFMSRLHLLVCFMSRFHHLVCFMLRFYYLLCYMSTLYSLGVL